MVLFLTDALKELVFPTSEFAIFLAPSVIERANIAPGRMGIGVGVEGDDPERFSLEESPDETVSGTGG